MAARLEYLSVDRPEDLVVYLDSKVYDLFKNKEFNFSEKQEVLIKGKQEKQVVYELLLPEGESYE